MARSTQLSIDLLELIALRDRPSIDEICLLTNGQLPRQSVSAELHSLCRRGHVIGHRRRDGAMGFEVSEDGRRARDLLIRARSRIAAKKRKPLDEIVADAVRRKRDSVEFPRAKLRLLAQAALASGRDLDPELRDAVSLAIQQAA